MGIKEKSAATVLSIAVLLIVVTVTGLYGMRSIGRDLQQIVEAERVAHLVESIQSRMSDNYAQMLAALQHDPAGTLSHLHDHGIEVHLDTIAENMAQTTMAADELQAIDIDDPRIMAQLVRVMESRTRFGAEGLLPAKSALQAGMFDEASMFIADLSDFYHSLRHESGELVGLVQDVVVDHQHAALDRHSAAQSYILLAAAIAVAVVLWLGSRLMNAAAALSALTQASLRIADNDLAPEVPHIASNDELGRLSRAVVSIRMKLVERVREIADMSQQVYSAVGTMVANAEQIHAGVERQQHETEQVATAMNEMTATVHEVARNTAAAANAASEADGEVASGSRVVRETISSIERLAGEVRKGAEVIGRLEDHSDNIGAVLDVIKGIAEQTNLLALNAAIEAARAGEQGRGFAVVADEVRTLAQRTQKSTQEIQQMIAKLQEGAREAVQVMEQGRSQAETSVTQAAQAGRSLDSIHSAVSTIHDMSTQIASAAEEQSSVAEEINRNIVNISQIVEQSAAGATQTATASEDLGELAERLQRVVQRFRLP